MKTIISIIIVVLLGVVGQTLATNHAEWLRFNSQKHGELIIDSAQGLDLSDEQLVERIVHYVKEFHSFEARHPIGFKCDVVYDFKYKKVPVAEIIGARRVPKVRMYCKGGCYDHWEYEVLRYGARKRYYHFDKCRGDF